MSAPTTLDEISKALKFMEERKRIARENYIKNKEKRKAYAREYYAKKKTNATSVVDEA